MIFFSRPLEGTTVGHETTRAGDHRAQISPWFSEDRAVGLYNSLQAPGTDITSASLGKGGEEAQSQESVFSKPPR